MMAVISSAYQPKSLLMKSMACPVDADPVLGILYGQIAES
jgi:hypothetical protein